MAFIRAPFSSDDLRELLIELHGDLTRKYKAHATSIEQLWRSFDSNQRERCMRGGGSCCALFQNEMENRCGSMFKFIPEMTLENVTKSGPDFLLDILKHRATTSLFEQLWTGVGDSRGDLSIMLGTIRTNEVSYGGPNKNSFTLFLDGKLYARSFTIPDGKIDSLPSVKAAIDHGTCIPTALANLVFQRQYNLLQPLNYLFDDVLRASSQSSDLRTVAKNALNATYGLAPQASPEEITIDDLAAMARSQRDGYQDHLTLLRAQPALLSYEVKKRFYSNPGLVPDDQGRCLSVQTDKHISVAFFETMNCVVKGLGIWRYISCLFSLLDGQDADNDVPRPTLLQELSNVCHTEYDHRQALLKQYVQTGSGTAWFRRVADAAGKGGHPRVSMKGDPAKLTRSDPQLHYILRLCQSGTSAAEAFEWVTKLGLLHNTHPDERDKLDEREADALCDMVAVTRFIHALSRVVQLPPRSTKRGATFTSGLQSLDGELNKLKIELDVRDFAAPISNLKEPGVAGQALGILDLFMVDKHGMVLGDLYMELVDNSVEKLHDQCQQAASKAKAAEIIENSPGPLFIESPPPKAADKFEQRRAKRKSRPSGNNSISELGPSHEEAAAVADELAALAVTQPATPPPVYKVSPATAAVFSKLFTKSESRGSIA